MMIALLHTDTTEFLAAGKTVKEARNILYVAYERRRKETTCLPFSEVEDMVEILVDVKPGKAYQDGEEI